MLVAGGTVVVSLLGMFLMGLPYLYGVALAASLAVLIVVAASLTLLPALLGFAGRGVTACGFPAPDRAPPDPHRTLAARWARAVQRRPWLAAGRDLGRCCCDDRAPLTGTRFGFPDAGNEHAGTTTRVAYDLVPDGFGPGANGPLFAVVDTPDAPPGERLRDSRRPSATSAGVAVRRSAAAAQPVRHHHPRGHHADDLAPGRRRPARSSSACATGRWPTRQWSGRPRRRDGGHRRPG